MVQSNFEGEFYANHVDTKNKYSFLPIIIHLSNSNFF